MGKHKTTEEWIELFNLFENDLASFNQTFFESYKGSKSKSNAFYRFRIKYIEYKYNNGMNDLVTRGQINTIVYQLANKKERDKNRKIVENKKELWKELIDSLPEDIVAEIVERWYEIEPNESGKKKEIEKIIKNSCLSSRKLSILLGVSKTTICNVRSGDYKKGYPKNIEASRRIKEIFEDRKGRVGRKPISIILFKEYGISLSYRQVGRIMNELNLHCRVRAKRKAREKKITDSKIPNIVARDYNNQKHDKTILATDVTYIDAPKDVSENHVYLSAIINHKTKLIEGYSLSRFNDNELVMESFKSIANQKNLIIHSDHGYQYLSNVFNLLVESNKWEQSMSRVGNSLDNREIEHWFCILKNELIYSLDIKNMTFNELKNQIDEYISYYNNQRIQEKLCWLSPQEYTIMLNRNVTVQI